ncbi:Glycosyltransferase involved in cell wall bisynthesis [Methylomagnum ishizawai]|uniref:Glycosyltransferase involved in cell wall bisynthesis n=1 Tax=Methylomagnum ishizawai TaxID=1760988 RepID=A0A1Y6D4V7_9GAMM|nr:glycosyltransferase family 4 protein [Methylomagnum ishizawai]SMF97460.1 Glycosyltransferase involved in cell wall bisynthesis [Methylomagnum ishizawai]
MSEHPRLAYLIGPYPTFSRPSVLGEIAELRHLGFTIAVAALDGPDPAPEGPDADGWAGAGPGPIWYPRRRGWIGAATALAVTLATRPLGFWRGLGLALGMGGCNPRRVARNLAHLAGAALLGRWLRAGGFDHLHVDCATPAATVGLLTQAMFGVGYSFTVHGPDEFYDAPGHALAEKIQGADFVICVSHYARSQMQRLSPLAQWPKFEVCRLGIDPERFAPVARPARPESFRLLCVGRLVPAQGQAVLLESVAALRQRGHNVHLTLVGDGPDRAALEALAAELRLREAVRFTGAIGRDAVLGLYARADACVLPSFAEGWPVVLMEAMATGLPCVASRIAGLPELIEDGVQGLLVAASDREGLADAIERLIGDPGLRANLAEAGRARVLADYVLRVNSARLGAVFQARLGRPATPGES